MSQIDVFPGKLFSPLQIRILGICFFLNMLDGMDVLAISFAAPAIAAHWQVTPQALGIVFSAALVGMALGAVFISPFTDRIGRRRMILLSISVISLGMIATSYAQSIQQLAALRLVAGVGIGSMLASLTALVSEYAPVERRNLAILILHAGYPIGAMIAGFVAVVILPEYGWRSLFLLAGLVSIAAVPLVYFLLPESLAFLLGRQPAGALNAVNKLLVRFGRETLSELPQRTYADKTTSGLGALFSDSLRQATLTLWAAFMLSFATLYFLFSWVVKLAIEAGLSVEHALYAGVALNLGAFFGSTCLGWISERFGLQTIISRFLFGGAVMCIVYSYCGSSVALILIALFVLMFFVQGGFTGLYAVAARVYPAEIRTTGVGWAIGAGRIGAILGPAIAGFILGAGVGINWTFILFSIPLLIAAIVIVRLPTSAIQ